MELKTPPVDAISFYKALAHHFIATHPPPIVIRPAKTQMVANPSINLSIQQLAHRHIDSEK